MTEHEIKVGEGSVALIDMMGSALTITNAARVSMGKRSESFDERDKRLIKYLWTHGHTSPFRHVTFQFRIKAPIFVLRQWMKHQVGCAWNEISGRYVELDESFWSPHLWREQSASVKQGSGGALEQSGQIDAHFVYVEAINAAVAAYQRLLQMGVCKEQARALLPVATMSECYWTCSLHALLNFFNQRLDSHAQQEIREYAQAVSELVESVEGLPFILETCLDRP